MSIVVLLLSPKVANFFPFTKISSGLSLAFLLIENIEFKPFMILKTSKAAIADSPQVSRYLISTAKSLYKGCLLS